MFQSILPDALVQAGGWTILHSLWQGAIITLLLAFILGRTREKSPILRYNLSVGALLLLLGTVAFTFLYYYEPGSGASALLSGSSPLGNTVPLVTALETTLPQESSFFDRFFPFLLQIWLVGVALMGIRMLGELAYLQRLRSSHTQAVTGHWVERMNALKWQMGVIQPIALRESTQVSGPMLVGWFKPVILLPLGILSNLSPQQVECILAHELAHVRRMDYLVNIIQSAVEVLLFFNPAVWWISAQIREEREHCCDELAVSITGDRITLVKTLAQLEEWRLQSGQLGLAFNGRPQGILGRVQRLLGGESTVRIIGKGLWSLLFFCMATGLLAFHHQLEPKESTWNGEHLDVEPDESIVDDTEVLNLLASAPKAATNHIAGPPSEPSVQTGLLRAAEMLNAFPRFKALEKLPSLFENIAVASLRQDTIPAEKFQKEMRALQLEMEKLQVKMMNSAEMKQMQELTRKLEVEMQKMQAELMKDQGGYEKMMAERQEVMKKLESRYQELAKSEKFRALEVEGEALSRAFNEQAEILTRKFQDDPVALDNKLDSLSQVFEERHEAFEKQHREVFEKYEQEMEALENSPEMKELELKLDAAHEEMEKLMEVQMKPLEAEIEGLQEVLKEKFEKQMRALEEQMEKLQMEFRSKEEKQREE